MKNPSTSKKLRTVLKAAIWGAVLFTVTILLHSLVNTMGPHESLNVFWDAISTFLGVLVFFQVMPAVFVMSALGFPDFSHPYMVYVQYIVNGLIGAIIFALVALFWAFVVKGRCKNPTAGIE
jgi:amino acid transporter